MTNDIFTREDGEFLIKNGALPPERIRAVETGGCPHAAIREDISINLGPLEELSHKFKTELLLCESGGGPIFNFFFKVQLFFSSVYKVSPCFQIIWLQIFQGNLQITSFILLMLLEEIKFQEKEAQELLRRIYW